jgi:phosphatidylglycerol---prolipoprotein diacylglyceryl transferase
MRQTLFVIPHQWLDGWPLIIWLVGGALMIAVMYFRKQSTKEIWSFIPVYLVVAVVIHFVVPQLEIKGLNPENPDGPLIPLGLAVRGYGLFMLLGIVAGIGVSIYRCRLANVPSDPVVSLCFWLIISGIIGARIFYIIQYWEDFSGDSNLLLSLVDMTKGGLVVYGSLIAALVCGPIYTWINSMRLWKTADILAPGMMIGLAFGRIGCLMNGCCWGSECDIEQLGLRFSAGSPPYSRQYDTGRLIGLETIRKDPKKLQYEIVGIQEDSIASKLPLRVGQQIIIGYVSDDPPLDEDQVEVVEKSEDVVLRGMHEQNLEFKYPGDMVILDDENNRYTIPLETLPAQSYPIHPTQLYSALNAFLIFAVLLLYHPFRRGDGETFAMLLIMYSPTRFLLEQIRSDEYGKFGTEITISQWVSLAVLACGIALLIWRRRTVRQTEQPVRR